MTPAASSDRTSLTCHTWFSGLKSRRQAFHVTDWELLSLAMMFTSGLILLTTGTRMSLSWLVFRKCANVRDFAETHTKIQMYKKCRTRWKNGDQRQLTLLNPRHCLLCYSGKANASITSELHTHTHTHTHTHAHIRGAAREKQTEGKKRFILKWGNGSENQVSGKSRFPEFSKIRKNWSFVEIIRKSRNKMNCHWHDSLCRYLGYILEYSNRRLVITLLEVHVHLNHDTCRVTWLTPAQEHNQYQPDSGMFQIWCPVLSILLLNLSMLWCRALPVVLAITCYCTVQSTNTIRSWIKVKKIKLKLNTAGVKTYRYDVLLHVHVFTIATALKECTTKHTHTRTHTHACTHKHTWHVILVLLVFSISDLSVPDRLPSFPISHVP